MLDSSLLIPIAILYLAVVLSLFLYGVNFYYLTYLAIKHHRSFVSSNMEMENWPRVTIQLPIFNEMYVAQRLVEAAAGLDYPADLLQIQVLDDSTDETVEIVAETVKILKGKGVNIVHLHRENRDGYKAGALRDGLESASGEFIALFDADFIPTKDFIRKTIPSFKDPEVAFVQGRWGHVNSDYSLLTFLQSLAIDAHFMIEQFARHNGGFIFNFNGTAGVWRKTAIVDAGGWQPRTLTEDLDLSYRAFLKGWRAIFLRDVMVPAELPVTFTGFRRQQHRWARGSLETARILLPLIWQSEMSLKLKIEATLHLTGYVVHLLLFALCLIYPLVLGLSTEYASLVSLFGLAILFSLTAFAPTVLFLVSRSHLGLNWRRSLLAILFLTVFGSGMMLNTVRAAWGALQAKSNVFERTPKHGITTRGQTWTTLKYQLKLDGIVFFEILLGAVNVASAIFALQTGHWFIAFYTTIFAAGLFFNSLYTISQSINGIQKA